MRSESGRNHDRDLAPRFDEGDRFCSWQPTNVLVGRARALHPPGAAAVRASASNVARAGRGAERRSVAKAPLAAVANGCLLSFVAARRSKRTRAHNSLAASCEAVVSNREPGLLLPPRSSRHERRDPDERFASSISGLMLTMESPWVFYKRETREPWLPQSCRTSSGCSGDEMLPVPSNQEPRLGDARSPYRPRNRACRRIERTRPNASQRVVYAKRLASEPVCA